MDPRELPKNELFWTAFNMYRASDLTKSLKSEQNRTIFAEQFETSEIPALLTLCLKAIADNYKGRPINLNLKPIQLRILYDFLDPELPIERCININDDHYWKRVFAVKCTDRMLVKQKNNDKNTNWKNLVITMKYVELIENTPYEIWIYDEMEKISKMVSPYVTDLKISKLQPMRDSSFIKQPVESETSTVSITSGTLGEEEQEEVIPEEPEEVEYDYPVQDCHHVDLGVLKNLLNLHSLTVEFLPPKLGINYHTRYFNFSYVDMQHLASGISELPNLKVFKIRRSRMDCVKLSTILEVIKSMFLEHLEFYYCQLDDECGESIYEFLISTACLKNFELSGNYFRDSAIDFLSDGIQNSPSQLTHLGLANNPISDESVCNLTNVLLTCKELTHLTLSGVKVTESGAACIAKLIKGHPNLEEVEILAVPMNGYNLVDAMQTNMKIQKLLCQACGLSLDDEFKIELLLKRNRYIKENPYIGDPTKTAEEINEYVSRTKNPILLEALAAMQRRTECLQKLADRERSPSELSFVFDKARTSLESEESSIRSREVRIRTKRFTEEDLDQVVTLYGQTEMNFFKKISPGKKNQ